MKRDHKSTGHKNAKGFLHEPSARTRELLILNRNQFRRVMNYHNLPTQLT
jgi:hypothetical protein